MKTVEEFIKEIDTSDTLKSQLTLIHDKETLGSFLKSSGCEGTAEEFVKAFKAKHEGEISDDVAENVAGGMYWGMFGL